MFQFKTVCHPTLDSARPLVEITSVQNGTKHLIGNVSEGVQRILSERKIKFSKVENIFLTGKLDWSGIGGLPGLLLTISDQGRKELNLIYGDFNLLGYVIATWRHFIFRFGMKFNLHEVCDEEEYKSDHFIVKPITVNLKAEKKCMADNVYNQIKDIVNFVFAPSQDTPQDQTFFKKGLSPPRELNSSVSYVLKFHEIRGKFLAGKATSLGVPKGPLFARLTKGQDVQLADGTVVTPSQVMEPSRQMKRVLFIDIPSNAFLAHNLSKDWLNIRFESQTGPSEPVGLVYHFLGRDVPDPFENPEYIRFIHSFGDECQHLISHPKYSPNLLNFHKSAKVLLKLKSLHDEFFTLPKFDMECTQVPAAFPNVKSLQANQSFFISPDKCSYTSADFELVKPQQYWDSLYENTVRQLELGGNVLKESDAFTENNSERSLKDSIEVVTLGTGSSLPSKYRNVISTLVRIPQVEGKMRSVIFDGGESTLYVLKRMYGTEYKTILGQVEMIYLSHLHADHHLGIISLIKEWCSLKDRPSKLHLVVPWKFDKFIKEWCSFENDIDLSAINYINCENIRDNAQPLEEMNILSMQTCKAIHCSFAYCVSFVFDLGDKSTFKVSYSGDTRPCIQFASMGQDSDLLIHEATLEDFLYEDAVSKKHSTISEAVYMGKLMRCRKLALTHFSQRYPKLPDLKASEGVNRYISEGNSGGIFLESEIFSQKLEQDEPMQVIYAFDQMKIRLADFDKQLPVFENMDPKKLEMMFADEQNEEDGGESLAKEKEKRNLQLSRRQEKLKSERQLKRKKS